MKYTTETHKLDLQLENSFGVIAKQSGVEVNITIRMQPSKNYGSFEMYDEKTGGDEWHTEGGLWFDGKELVDYDGIFALPTAIIDTLEKQGYNCEYAK